jgi:hypothetical protein
VGEAAAGDATADVAVATAGVFVSWTERVGVFWTANWVRFASTVWAAAVRIAPGPSGSWVLAGRLQALKARVRNKTIESSRDGLDMYLCYSWMVILIDHKLL